MKLVDHYGWHENTREATTKNPIQPQDTERLPLFYTRMVITVQPLYFQFTNACLDCSERLHDESHNDYEHDARGTIAFHHEQQIHDDGTNVSHGH